MVFGPDFPYKLGQLSSSNKNSGISFYRPFKKRLLKPVWQEVLAEACPSRQERKID
jgi:hypothetical protein